MTTKEKSEFYKLLDVVFDECFRDGKRYHGDRHSERRFSEFFRFQKGVRDMLEHPMLEDMVEQGHTQIIITRILSKAVRDPLSSHFTRLRHQDPDQYLLVTESIEGLLEYILDKVTDSSQAVAYADDAVKEIQQQKLDVESLKEQLERLQEACAILKKHKGHGEFTDQNMRDKFLQLVDKPIHIKLAAMMSDWKDLSDKDKWTQMNIAALRKQQKLYHSSKDSRSRRPSRSPARSDTSNSRSRSRSPRDRRNRSTSKSPKQDNKRRPDRGEAKLNLLNNNKPTSPIPQAGHVRGPARQATPDDECHGCGKKGHFRKDCPTHGPGSNKEPHRRFKPRFAPRHPISGMTSRTKVLKYIQHLFEDQDYTCQELHALLSEDYGGGGDDKTVDSESELDNESILDITDGSASELDLNSIVSDIESEDPDSDRGSGDDTDGNEQHFRSRGR
jgi:hypothetical protein